MDKNYFKEKGKKGGDKTRELYGSDYYRYIGRKGGSKKGENFKKALKLNSDIIQTKP